LKFLKTRLTTELFRLNYKPTLNSRCVFGTSCSTTTTFSNRNKRFLVFSTVVLIFFYSFCSYFSNLVLTGILSAINGKLKYRHCLWYEIGILYIYIFLGKRYGLVKIHVCSFSLESFKHGQTM